MGLYTGIVRNAHRAPYRVLMQRAAEGAIMTPAYHPASSFWISLALTAGMIVILIQAMGRV